MEISYLALFIIHAIIWSLSLKSILTPSMSEVAVISVRFVVLTHTLTNKMSESGQVECSGSTQWERPLRWSQVFTHSMLDHHNIRSRPVAENLK